MCATRGAVSSRPLMPDQILPNHAALERILYDPPSRSRPVTRRTAAARGTRQARRHCHSTVSARGGTLRGEWQCGRYVHARVAVRPARTARPRPEWQCVSHCHSVSSAPNRHARGASGSAPGAPRAEWRCGSHCHSTVNARGGTPEGRVAVRPAKPEGPGCSGPCQPFYKQCWYRVARPMEGCLLARGGAGQLACPRATRPPFPKHGRGRPCAIPTSTSGGPPRTRSRSTRSRRCQVRCDTNRRACSHASSRTP